MRSAFLFVVLSVVLSVASISGQTKVSDELTLAAGVSKHAALDDVYTRFSKAYRELDASAFAHIYTSNAAYLAPGQDIQIGGDQIAKSFAGFFNSIKQRDSRLTISFNIVQRKVEGSLSYDVGVYTLTTFNKENSEIGMGRGKFVVVGVREGSQWKFQVDGFSPMPEESPKAEPTIDSFGWLAGCWEMKVPERQMTVTESWTKPAAGTMIGMGRTVVGDRTVSYEFLRIVAIAEGIDYIAKPSQSPTETAFRLKTSGTNEVVFENLNHDFPQRIIYRKPNADSLFARIEGMRDGRVGGMDIPMKRVKCD